jgi:hypothetical protein
LAASSSALRTQLSLLNTREEAIRQSRADEGNSFTKRTASNNKLLLAVGQIKNRLIQTINDSNGVLLEKAQQEQIVADIKRELGDRNPIAVLAQLTTKY